MHVYNLPFRKSRYNQSLLQVAKRLFSLLVAAQNFGLPAGLAVFNSLQYSIFPFQIHTKTRGLLCEPFQDIFQTHSLQGSVLAVIRQGTMELCSGQPLYIGVSSQSAYSHFMSMQNHHLLNMLVQQVLKQYLLIQHCVIQLIMLMRCHRSLTLVYITQPVIKLVSLYIILLKVAESISDGKGGHNVYIQVCDP